MITNITTRDVGDVTVIDVSGRLTLIEGSIALHERIRELAGTGFNRILINMAGIMSIDSSGLGVLVAAYTTVNRAGGEMKLLNAGERVKQLLRVIKLCVIFETHDDENSAIRSFSPAQTVARFESRSESSFG
jgi:anti-sigma B factor antagonist